MWSLVSAEASFAADPRCLRVNPRGHLCLGVCYFLTSGCCNQFSCFCVFVVLGSFCFCCVCFVFVVFLAGVLSKFSSGEIENFAAW